MHQDPLAPAEAFQLPEEDEEEEEFSKKRLKDIEIEKIRT